MFTATTEKQNRKFDSPKDNDGTTELSIEIRKKR
jgi:hypothetical protein